MKAGQVLAELDRVEMVAQVRQSEAQLQSSEATQRSAEADLARSKVDAEGVDVAILARYRWGNRPGFAWSPSRTRHFRAR